MKNSDYKIIIPARKKSSHKGDNGTVLAIGGSEDFPGAVALAGLAALRSGCDIVRILSPEKTAWAINCFSPDLITVKAKGKVLGMQHLAMIEEYASKSDVILIGNGIGLGKNTKQLCQDIVKLKNFKVIDADAIKSVSFDGIHDSIVTPHSRELDIFIENSKIDVLSREKIKNEPDAKRKAKLIQACCKEFLGKNNIILLKGMADIILSKDNTYFIEGGNAGMTKGGTGDVLAGLCAGFLAQSKDILQSAINASYFNKKVGDILLKKKKGFTYLASDMVEEIKKIQSWM